jgi:hypothetical protein
MAQVTRDHLYFHRRLDLRQQQCIRPSTGAHQVQHCQQVAQTRLRINGVDAQAKQEALARRCGALAEPPHHPGPGRVLVPWADRIFQVDDHAIGTRAFGLAETLRPGAGGKEQALDGVQVDQFHCLFST